jgi:hypothetical protein
MVLLYRSSRHMLQDRLDLLSLVLITPTLLESDVMESMSLRLFTNLLVFMIILDSFSMTFKAE